MISNKLRSQPHVEPLFIRVPSQGARCPHCGLARTTIDMLTRPQAVNNFKPPVKSRMFKFVGSVSKVRLVDYQSLKAYLNSMPDGSLQD